MKEQKIFFKITWFQKEILKNVDTVTQQAEVYQKRYNSAFEIGDVTYRRSVFTTLFRFFVLLNLLLFRRDRNGKRIKPPLRLLAPFLNELS